MVCEPNVSAEVTVLSFSLLSRIEQTIHEDILKFNLHLPQWTVRNADTVGVFECFSNPHPDRGVLINP
jgi:hypothetical protein